MLEKFKTFLVVTTSLLAIFLLIWNVSLQKKNTDLLFQKSQEWDSFAKDCSGNHLFGSNYDITGLTTVTASCGTTSISEDFVSICKKLSGTINKDPDKSAQWTWKCEKEFEVRK